MPLISAAIMCAVTVGTNTLISFLIRKHAGDPDMMISGMDNLLRLIVSILVAVIVYGVSCMKQGTIRESEIALIPGTAGLVEFLKRIRLLKEK